jgi:hypothetical protein
MNEDRDWPGAAALVLAAALGIGWAGGVIIAATPWGPELNEQSANLFNGIGQVLAGALATYLGVRVGAVTPGADTDLDDYEDDYEEETDADYEETDADYEDAYEDEAGLETTEDAPVAKE